MMDNDSSENNNTICADDINDASIRVVSNKCERVLDLVFLVRGSIDSLSEKQLLEVYEVVCQRVKQLDGHCRDARRALRRLRRKGHAKGKA